MRSSNLVESTHIKSIHTSVEVYSHDANDLVVVLFVRVVYRLPFLLPTPTKRGSSREMGFSFSFLNGGTRSREKTKQKKNYRY